VRRKVKLEDAFEDIARSTGQARRSDAARRRAAAAGTLRWRPVHARARSPGQPAVLICDRGAMDGSACAPPRAARRRGPRATA
jgi:hypothetical protein